MAFSIVMSAAIQGVQAELVKVETDVSNGLPVFHMVGYLSSEVKEAAERVRTAIQNCGINLPPKKIVVNLAPATMRKKGASFDLPIALSVLAAEGVFSGEVLQGVLVAGELGLGGKVQKISGVFPMVKRAAEEGYHTCIIPRENAAEGAFAGAVRIIGVSDLGEVCRYLRGEEEPPETAGTSWETWEAEARGKFSDDQVDFCDIRGQKVVKRAAEIAVSGGHNLLLIGPPGSGKSMTAKAVTGILPSLSREEGMEITKIYSVMGLLREDQPLIRTRPFRNVHHTITKAALVGGGNFPLPGEVSLAHGGVLFLDELAEFQKQVLEVLRQPLEEQEIHLSRSHGNYVFPADVMLVAAMNPCPCGNYPDLERCHCTPGQIKRYLDKVSQPFLDRMDLCVEAPRISYEDLTRKKEEETSEKIRLRVERAREIQKKRYAGTKIRVNARLGIRELSSYCKLGKEEEQLMEQAFEILHLTARTYHRILKVARTIADMEEEETILVHHIKEAIGYRTLDKKYWEGEHMIYEYWLARIRSLGDQKKRKLRMCIGTGKEIYYIEETKLGKISFLTEKDIQVLRAARKQKNLQEEYEKLIRQEITFVPYFQETYPNRLQNALSPPYALYVKGKLPQAELPSVAIVGARNCTPYGEKMALEYARILSEAGIQIISGMARGIDGAAQRGALNGGGRTYAVLGCGVDICYPGEHQGLYRDILKEGGGLLSEQLPGEPPLARHFPARNRIISGLSDIVLVIEARERSGSLITADMALEEGKDVYALPGPVTSPVSCGCHRLIAQGAGILLSPEELLEMFGYKKEKFRQKPNKNEKVLETTENIVYSCLGLYPKGIDALVRETGLSPSNLMEQLMTLELQGDIKEISRNQYIKVR